MRRAKPKILVWAGRFVTGDRLIVLAAALVVAFRVHHIRYRGACSPSRPGCRGLDWHAIADEQSSRVTLAARLAATPVGEAALFGSVEATNASSC